jgi:hypothetical protein
MPDHKAGCLVCGEDLHYLKTPEKLECSFCQKEFESEVKCKSGHFICDGCHSLPANDLIEQYCINSDSEDPLEMALNLMRSPQVKMHGPEHHYLIPAVLITTFYNIKKDQESKQKNLKKAKGRAEKVLGGFCGFYGNCGAAVGTGIFISLISGATPLSKEEWKLANLMTARSLQTIANHGGPRCCKRNTYLAIKEAVNFLKENFDVKMNINEDIKCEFNKYNKECLEDECMFYNE